MRFFERVEGRRGITFPLSWRSAMATGISRRWGLLAFSLGLLLWPTLLHAKGPGGGKTESNLVITTNWGEDSCSLVDIKQGTELAKIKVGMKPYDVKVDSRGRFAFVTCSGEDFLSTIDLQAMLEMEDKRVVVGASPRDVAINTDNTRAVVACAGTDNIAVVDLIK